MKKLLILLAVLVSSMPRAEAQTGERSQSVITIDGQGYYVHTVQKGETIYGLSKLYSVDERTIKSNNPQVIEGLREGQVLKIPAAKEPAEKLSARKHNKIFDTHIVNQGETLYSISRLYEIPVNTILEDNEGLDPVHMSIGQKLNIRKKSKGDASPQQIAEQIEEYRDAANSVMADARVHMVEKGETIYGLSRLYGVTEDEIKRANAGLPEGLKAGALIKIPTGKDPEQGRVVPGGDGASGNPEDGQEYGDALAIRDISGKEMINVAMLLPLKDDSDKSNKNFYEFYQGALLAMEDLKADGISVRLSLYNTSRSEKSVSDIVGKPEFAATDMIIGPVYEESVKPALAFAERNGVAIISPLGAMDNVESPVMFQVAPSAENKYDKLRDMLTAEKNIVYITTNYKDDEMEKEVRTMLPANARFVNFTGNVKSVSFREYVDRAKENLFVISCTNELTVDQLLASIGSVQNNMVGRGMGNPTIHVLGSSRWARFRGNSVDRNLYFKLGVCYITSYHADRGNEMVRAFDKRFLKVHGIMPSLYAYRGYDVAKMFVHAAKKGQGGDFAAKIASDEVQLLQMPYRFSRKSNGEDQANSGFINRDWALVCYSSDYSITVK